MIIYTKVHIHFVHTKVSIHSSEDTFVHTKVRRYGYEGIIRMKVFLDGYIQVDPTTPGTVQAYQNLGPGMMEPSMTKEWLRSSCRESGGYVSPPLNDILYLHFKGFAHIQNLEEYTQVKSGSLKGTV